MQMLMCTGSEYGSKPGLGLIEGEVKRIPAKENGKTIRKIPHIGWNRIYGLQGEDDWETTCLKTTPQFEEFYFVHSYQAVPLNRSHILAYTTYEGLEINAAVSCDNVTGLQFHPERSGEAGLAVLKEFVSR